MNFPVFYLETLDQLLKIFKEIKPGSFFSEQFDGPIAFLLYDLEW